MYFQKNRHPSNFSFANGHAHNTLTLGSKSVRIGLRDLGEDVFHVELEDAVRWPLDARTLPMCMPLPLPTPPPLLSECPHKMPIAVRDK